MGDFTITQQPSSKNLYLYPTGNGCDNNTYPFGDSPQWECVSEEHDSLTGDDDFVFQDGAAVISDLYQIDDHTTETGTINYVQARCRAKSDMFPPAHDAVYKIMIAQNSGCSDFAQSDNQPLNTSFTTFRKSWDENPFTDAAWTWDNVDDLQVGFEMSSPSVTASPYALIPIEDGDRTDINSVTTGYDHWEAVQADRPLSQVEESGAAWAYDLYRFIYTTSTPSDSYINRARYCNQLIDGYLVSSATGLGVYIHKIENNGQYFKYLTNYDDGSHGAIYNMTTDGTYYYSGEEESIVTYEYDVSSNTIDVIATTTLEDAGGGACYSLKYIEDYSVIIAGYGNGVVADKNIFILQVNGDGTLTELSSKTFATTKSSSVDSDATYVYANDDDDLIAYSFDGTTLTEITRLTANGTIYDISVDENQQIMLSLGGTGLELMSFDGVNLTSDDTIDNGGTYQQLCYSGGYWHTACVVGTVAVADEVRAYSVSGGVISYDGTYENDPRYGYECVETDGSFIFVVGDNSGSVPVPQQSLVFNGSNYREITSTDNGMLSKYLDDNIESVTVILKMGKEYDADDEADIRGRAIIKTNGTEYTSDDYVTLEYPKRWYAFTWDDNPDTSAAWTLSEVQELQAGVGLYGDGTSYAACSVCQLVVASSTSVSPEFHTSRLNLKVNYSPPEESISLSKPSNWERSHDRITKIINFWSGNREVYDLSRGGKKVLLRGTEYSSDNSYNPCDRIQNVITMAERGDTVTLSDTGFCALDDEFRILSFGWDLVSEKPVSYKWMLELEFAE